MILPILPWIFRPNYLSEYLPDKSRFLRTDWGVTPHTRPPGSYAPWVLFPGFFWWSKGQEIIERPKILHQKDEQFMFCCHCSSLFPFSNLFQIFLGLSMHPANEEYVTEELENVIAFHVGLEYPVPFTVCISKALAKRSNIVCQAFEIYLSSKMFHCLASCSSNNFCLRQSKHVFERF